MPYNLEMNQLTLVLPFALPPPELATDLLHVLEAPALSALLSRTKSQQFHSCDDSLRVLPHEAWLAHALGLAPAPAGPAAQAPLAPAVMRGLGLGQAEEGTWFIINPVHVEIARNHLQMEDQRHLALEEADSHALFDAAKPYFDEVGKPLIYGNAQTWFMRADDWAGLDTATLDAATGQNLHAWMPEGPGALACSKLQNEVQMAWHEHPINEARQARNLAPVNSFWPWGGAAATPARQGPALFVGAGPAWLSALADAAPPDFAAVIMHESALVVLPTLIEAALASDWSSWLTLMVRLEREWCVPLLAAVKDGRIGQLTLVLSHRFAFAQWSSTKLAQRKFWQPVTLNSLLP